MTVYYSLSLWFYDQIDCLVTEINSLDKLHQEERITMYSLLWLKNCQNLCTWSFFPMHHDIISPSRYGDVFNRIEVMASCRDSNFSCANVTPSRSFISYILEWARALEKSNTFTFGHLLNIPHSFCWGTVS